MNVRSFFDPRILLFLTVSLFCALPQTDSEKISRYHNAAEKHREFASLRVQVDSEGGKLWLKCLVNIVFCRESDAISGPREPRCYPKPIAQEHVAKHRGQGIIAPMVFCVAYDPQVPEDDIKLFNYLVEPAKSHGVDGVRVDESWSPTLGEIAHVCQRGVFEPHCPGYGSISIDFVPIHAWVIGGAESPSLEIAGVMYWAHLVLTAALRMFGERCEQALEQYDFFERRRSSVGYSAAWFMLGICDLRERFQECCILREEVTVLWKRYYKACVAVTPFERSNNFPSSQFDDDRRRARFDIKYNLTNRWKKSEVLFDKLASKQSDGRAVFIGWDGDLRSVVIAPHLMENFFPFQESVESDVEKLTVDESGSSQIQDYDLFGADGFLDVLVAWYHKGGF